MIARVLVIILCSHCVCGQSAHAIRIHFLYGSRPHPAYKESEKRWFGGRLGGHVGIEYAPGRVLSFVPRGRFHLFSRPRNVHSAFAVHAVSEFYSIFGADPGSVKSAIVTIPLKPSQRSLVDSIVYTYRSQTPYDYALIGMRCAAATYDILAHSGVVRKYRPLKTIWKIFYPRKLRKLLFRKAEAKGWQVDWQPGSTKRKWDRD